MATDYFSPLSGATYIRLRTFRRDGTGVDTTVHVVCDGGAAFFRTWDVSGKAKRLRHTAAVEVTRATIGGRPRGEPIRAEARLLRDEQARRAASLLAARHPVLHGHLIPWVHRRRGWVTQQYRLTPPGSTG